MRRRSLRARRYSSSEGFPVGPRAPFHGLERGNSNAIEAEAERCQI